LQLLLVAVAETGCPDVPVYREGRVSSSICEAAALVGGYTILDLSNGWAPRLFSEAPGLPQPSSFGT